LTFQVAIRIEPTVPARTGAASEGVESAS